MFKILFLMLRLQRINGCIKNFGAPLHISTDQSSHFKQYYFKDFHKHTFKNDSLILAIKWFNWTIPQNAENNGIM